MDEQAFTWFPKLTEMLERVARDFPADAGAFALAVAEYGTRGTQPVFENPALEYAFFGVQSDIDHSLSARESGARGGRRRKADGTGGGPCDGAQGRCAEGATPLSEDGKGGCDGAQPITIQSNTEQDKTEQKKGGARAARFAPPTPDEVAEFARSCTPPLAVDAAAFCDFYASKGWKVGREPMRDWRAAARNWARRDRAAPGRPGAAGAVSAHDAYSEL